MRQFTTEQREGDLNPRPLGYEPSELPNCSIPRHYIKLSPEHTPITTMLLRTKSTYSSFHYQRSPFNKISNPKQVCYYAKGKSILTSYGVTFYCPPYSIWFRPTHYKMAASKPTSLFFQFLWQENLKLTVPVSLTYANKVASALTGFSLKPCYLLREGNSHMSFLEFSRW